MSMPEKNLLGTQVKRLLSGLVDHGSQHLAEVETDLVQTNVLLCEAIEKLGASFMAINEAIEAQQSAIELLLSGKAKTPETTQILRNTKAEIGLHVNAAVTGLQ